MFNSIYKSLGGENSTSEILTLDEELDILFEDDNTFLTINECLKFVNGNDNVILDEGIKEIFDKVKNVKTELDKFSKAKNKLNKELGLNVDKIVHKFDSDIKDISSLISSTKYDEKSLNLLNKELGNKFNNLIPKLIKELTDKASEILDDVYTEYYDNGIDNDVYEKFIKSTLIVSIASLINMTLMVIFTLSFGSELGPKICACCVAPLSEEIGKLVGEKCVGSISSNKNISAYNIVFNLYEFTDYFIKIYSSLVRGGFSKKDSALTAVKYRIPAVLLHSVNTAIIKHGMKKELGGEKAVLITMVIHCLFNSFAVFGLDDKIKSNIDSKIKKEDIILHEGFIFNI